MSKPAFIQTLEFNRRAFLANVEEMSHAESLQLVPGLEKSVNWLVGHIIEYRNHMLDQVKMPHVGPEGLTELYAQGTDGHSPGGKGHSFEVLLEAFETAQLRLTAGLDKLYAGPEVPEETLIRLNRYIAHEMYHVGQIGLIRKMMGKDSRIP